MCIDPVDMTADEIVMPPDPAPVDWSRLEHFEHIVKELGDTHFIMGRVPAGLFPWQETLGSVDGFLLKMYDEPAFVERAVEAQTREAIAYAQAMLEIGCDAVSPDGDVCDNRGPTMGPELFRRYSLPSVKRLADAIHAKGGWDVMHSDGYLWPILDDLVSAGIDGWQGIQPRIGMDMKLLKERFGDRLCLFGGVDIDTLVLGDAGRRRGPGGVRDRSRRSRVVGWSWDPGTRSCPGFARELPGDAGHHPPARRLSGSRLTTRGMPLFRGAIS